MLISALLGLSAMAMTLDQRDPTQAPRDAFSRCLFAFADAQVQERKPLAEFEAALPQQCQNEERAFQALTPRACRIFMQASTPAGSLSGALPNPYAMYLEVWGAPLHGQASAKPMEGDIGAWRNDFRPEDLEELVRLSIQFANTASVAPN
jgi:hypothetical protein